MANITIPPLLQARLSALPNCRTLAYECRMAKIAVVCIDEQVVKKKAFLNFLGAKL